MYRLNVTEFPRKPTSMEKLDWYVTALCDMSGFLRTYLMDGPNHMEEDVQYTFSVFLENDAECLCFITAIFFHRYQMTITRW